MNVMIGLFLAQLREEESPSLTYVYLEEGIEIHSAKSPTIFVNSELYIG